MNRITCLLTLMVLSLGATTAQSNRIVEKYINHYRPFSNAFFFTDPKYAIHQNLDSIDVKVEKSADLLDLLKLNLAGKVDAVALEGNESLDLENCIQLLQQFPRLKFLSFSELFLLRNNNSRKYELPAGISLLTGLQGLDFKTGNKLDLSKSLQLLAGLPGLTVLSFSDYSFPLPADIANLKHVECIRLRTDNLADSGLPFNLSWKQVFLMKGKAPAKNAMNQLAKLPDLRSLRLENISADDLEGFAHWKKLETLELRVVEKGRQPILSKLFPGLTQLKSLLLYSVSDSLETLRGLDQLHHLESLSLRWNAFLKYNPAQLSYISELQQLRNLEISNVRVIPVQFNQLKKLEVLTLDENELDSLPTGIFSLPRLTQLNINSCRLKYLPDTRWNLPDLKQIRCSYNTLKSLPVAITSLSNLEVLDLSRNAIEQLPLNDWERLTRLKTVNVSFNKIKQLPEGMLNISELITADLSNNDISEVPPLTAELHHLKVLDLAFNRVNQLPESIGRLDSLELLNLRGNRLTALPESIGNLQQLRELNVNSETRHKKNGKDELDSNEVNHIAALPAGLQKAGKLTLLDLGDNFNIDEQSVFAVLLAQPRPGLRADLSGCGIDSLPGNDSWKNMTFSMLKLNNNRLKFLPFAFSKMKAFTGLSISNNQLPLDRAIMDIPINNSAELSLIYNEMGHNTLYVKEDYAKALCLAIRGCYYQKNWGKAVAFARQALSIDSATYNSNVNWDQIGVARYHCQDYKAAIADFERYINKEAATHIHWGASLAEVATYKSRAHLELKQKREAADTYTYFASKHRVKGAFQQAALLMLELGDKQKYEHLMDSATANLQVSYNWQKKQPFQVGLEVVADLAENLIMTGKYEEAGQLLADAGDSTGHGTFRPVKYYLVAMATYLQQPERFNDIKNELAVRIQTSGPVKGNWSFDLFNHWMELTVKQEQKRRQMKELENLAKQ